MEEPQSSVWQSDSAWGSQIKRAERPGGNWAVKAVAETLQSLPFVTGAPWARLLANVRTSQTHAKLGAKPNHPVCVPF